MSHTVSGQYCVLAVTDPAYTDIKKETGNQYECPVQYTVSGLYCVPAVTHPAYTDIGNWEPV